MFYSVAKRLFDVVGAASALVVLSPVLACVALAVRLKVGPPVLFTQVRPGKGCEPFTLYKFRTMTDVLGDNGELLPDGDRLTRFGAFLRSTSLDELPELWNIVRGDMSFVGPRPLLMRYVARYTPTQLRRHEVLPGLTGLAQVSGRNDMTWEEKFETDVWYVDNATMILDIKLLFRTVGTVLKRDGVSSDGEATAAEFFG